MKSTKEILKDIKEKGYNAKNQLNTFGCMATTAFTYVNSGQTEDFFLKQLETAQKQLENIKTTFNQLAPTEYSPSSALPSRIAAYKKKTGISHIEKQIKILKYILY